MSRKSALFITGSGKCGTSVVAHAFYSAGFPMGSKADLLSDEGSKGNIRGYWEHTAILALNCKILAHNGLDWHTAAGRGNLRINDTLRQEMRSLVEELPDGWCCKEPRLVWTADLWSEFFSDLTLVAVFRNPAGFLRSVANVWPDRYASDVRAEDPQALNTWEDTNRKLLELSRRFPIHWVCFDDPVPMLKERLRQIVERLGKRFDAAAFDSFFIPEERRFSSQDDIYDSLHSVPPTIVRIYQELRSALDADLELSQPADIRAEVSNAPALDPGHSI
jgi:hypothetical protein